MLKGVKGIHITSPNVLKIGFKYITNNPALTQDVFRSNMINLCYIYNLIMKHYKQILYDTDRSTYRQTLLLPAQLKINFTAFNMYIMHMLEIHTRLFLQITDENAIINKAICENYFKPPLTDYMFKQKFADIFTSRTDMTDLDKPYTTIFIKLWDEYNRK